MRDRVPPRLRLRPTVAAAACALLVAAPGTAIAAVSDVQPIDGPSSQVTDIEDAAMAEDGTGGIVYLRQVDGHSHVFAVQFRDGLWGAPQRVDTGQNFDSSWARIGASDGGGLVVTWVQEFGVETDRMFSATLDSGATGFQGPVPVDFNVGEATSTYPDLAMNSGGQAYLVYLVVTDTSPANPPGYLGIDVRVARYNNRLWSVLGNPINRSPVIPIRAPTENTAPKIGIDVNGQAVVAWQEPGDDFVDRVWARRVFGTSVGIPLQVSPSDWDGAPLRGAADAFSLDVAGFGQAAIAFRQQPGQSGKLDAPRVFVNEIPDAFSNGANTFGGPRLADGGAQGGLGAPSVAVEPNGLFLTGFGSGGASLLGSGDNTTINSAERLDGGASTVAGDPQVDLAPTGAAVAAWRELSGGHGLVGVQERRADGVAEPATLSAPRGGAVGRLVMAGSGLGDAIVAWKQGSGANAQVAAAVVDAPPDPFLVQLPDGWQRKPRIPISWDAAPNAIGGIRYSVSVDDEQIGKETTNLRVLLASKRVGDGRHRAQVFAIDDNGQATGSRQGLLLIDRRPPKVRLRRRGRSLTVTVSDGPRRITSGLRRSSVKVSFGDGRGASTSASTGGRSRGRKHAAKVSERHTFSGPGAYRVVVKARDRAGNRAVFQRKVRVG